MPVEQAYSNARNLLSPCLTLMGGDSSIRLPNASDGVAREIADAFKGTAQLSVVPSKEINQVSQAAGEGERVSQPTEADAKNCASTRPAPIDILLVDDDPETLLCLESILVSPDLNIVKANSGKEALQLLWQRDYAVILLDVLMAEMDGFQTAELIRQSEKFHHIPIIFLTGYGWMGSQVSKGYSIGAVDYLFKPVHPEILKAKVSVFVDLYKKTEELKNRQEELEQANRELEGFSYTVSHDLRTPLRHIEGFVHLLLKHALSRIDKTSLRYLKVISQSARQMGRLIDDLLEFSRMSQAAISLSRVNLDQLVRGTILDLRQDQGDHVIDWKIESLPEVTADPAMLHQVIVNYLTNAIKYTQRRKRAKIHIGSIPNEKETIVFVRDNGIGFDMQSADKLFCIFQRLHGSERFEGTGIGLAIVRRIIQRHGGETWAEGKVNKGATFYFSLPNPQTERPVELTQNFGGSLGAK